MSRVARFRHVSTVWDAAFGRCLERYLAGELALELATPPVSVLPIGSISLRPLLCHRGPVQVPAKLLKYLSCPTVREGLSEAFATNTPLRMVEGGTLGLLRDYTSMAGFRSLTGIRAMQLPHVPKVVLPEKVGRSLAFAFPWLRCLSLYDSFVTGADLDEFSGFPHLTELDLSWCLRLERFDGLLHFPGLAALNLQATSIDGVALYTFVAQMHELRTLNLIGCYKLAAVDFSRLLLCLPRLDELALTGVKAPTLQTGVEHPRRWQGSLPLAADLAHTELDAEALKGWCGAPLRSLSLEYCLTLTPQGLDAIRQLAPTLLSLNLRQNAHITSASLVFLSSLKNLKELSVARCSLVDDAAMLYLCDLPSVEALDLEYTAVTDRGLSFLGVWRQLKRLSVVGVGCSMESLQLFVLLAQRGLQYLNVAGCNRLPSSAVIYVREMPGLTVQC